MVARLAPRPQSTSDEAHPKPPSALETALDLRARDFWPIAIHPPGITVQGWNVPTRGKEPIGPDWGLNQWTERRLHAAFQRQPEAGVGICFGPGRGPGGSWLIDLDGDGPQAARSLREFLGGAIIPLLGWSSARGHHTVLSADGNRLLTLLVQAGAREGRGVQVGVWHVPALPDLEIRIGGHKADGTVKQVQSVVPPTQGRRWDHA